MTNICEQITEKVGELFVCSQINDYVRIRTPFLYPDGDYIDLFFKEQDTNVILTDLGETLRWLKMQTASVKRTQKQTDLIKDVCLNHNVEFERGMLLIRPKQSEDLGLSVIRLAQAALRVSDLWFTFRYQLSESITEKVTSLLEENRVFFEQPYVLEGRSGHKRRVDFYTEHSGSSSLIYLLSTGNKNAASRIADNAVTTWVDLSNLREDYHFISLFDDRLDVWTLEDFRLMENLSDIAYWSQPDQLLEKLAA